MRDDIFKRVALPRSSSAWMSRASGQADAISGHSRVALDSSLCIVFEQEFITRFQSALLDLAKEADLLLPGIRLHWACMAPDAEGPLGDRVAAEILCRAAMDRSLIAQERLCERCERA